MTERSIAEVLFANEAFYAAFAAGSFEDMAAIWSDSDTVCCLHPGQPPIHGRDAILESWRDILREPPPIRCVEPVLLPLGEEGAAVVCWEVIDGGQLIATNLFRREQGLWQIVHHQAGPLSVQVPLSLPEEDAPHALN